jgi:ribonuclease R
VEPWARVTRRLGRPGEPDADVAAVVWRHRLPGPFTPEVLEEAARAAAEPIADEVARRVDLRELPFVTIDPATARDHDDAIALESLEDGRHRLHVAIADVSHYVATGSPLDREALRRGNSVYFPDRAIPMLPPALSSDACSLREGRDRLALVVELVYDDRGERLRRGFYPAVIRSRAQIPYEQAEAVMRGEAEHPQAAMLRALDALAATLSERRHRAGALSLDLPESTVRFDAAGHPVDVLRARQGIAHRAVEESMLAANRAVAAQLVASRLTAIYRNHDPPAPDDLARLESVLRRFGLHEGGELDGPALSAALDRTPEELARVVHPIALRAMRQARYGDVCRGHYALAADSYLHFTSPIRRYPDLVVHRALKARLAGEAPRLDPMRARRMAARCSFRERLAERAERELVDLKKCAFLAGHVGEELDGSVTGVARHGLYVTLDRWPIEGLVHVSSLPEFVSLDAEELSLVAEGSRRRYTLGDRLRVAVAAVDPIRARIDFEIRRVLEVSPLGSGGRRPPGS